MVFTQISSFSFLYMNHLPIRKHPKGRAGPLTTHLGTAQLTFPPDARGLLSDWLNENILPLLQFTSESEHRHSYGLNCVSPKSTG